MDRRPVIEQLKNAVERIVLLPVQSAIGAGRGQGQIGALATVRHTLHGAAELNAGNARRYSTSA